MSAKILKKLFFTGLILSGLVLLFLPQLKKNRGHWQYYLNKNLGTAEIFKLYDEVVFDEDNLYFNSENHKTYSLSQKDGQPNWFFSGQNHSPYPPKLTQNFVIIASFDGFIYGLNKKTGQELWHYEIPDHSSPDTPITLSADEKYLFFGSRKGLLIALETESGQEVWQTKFPAIDNTKEQLKPPIHFGSIWTYQDLILVAHAPTETLYAFNSQSKEQVWKTQNFKHTYSQPIFKNNFALFKQLNQVTSVDLTTGTNQKITVVAEPWEMDVRSLGQENNSVAIVDKKNIYLYSVDLKQNLSINKNIQITIKLLEPELTQLFSQEFDLQKTLTTLNPIDPVTGQKSGTLEFPTTPFTTAHQSNERLILGNSSGQIVALETQNWTKIFELKVDHKVVLIQPNSYGYLIISQKPNSFLSLTEVNSNGEKIWEYTPNQPLNLENIYFWRDLVVFTSEDEQVVESLNITTQKPNNAHKNLINFTLVPNNEEESPYLEMVEKKSNSIGLKAAVNKLKFLVRNFSKLHQFEFSNETIGTIQQITINHNDLAYSNPQQQVKVRAEFINQETSDRVKISGYYSGRDKWRINFLPPTTGVYQAKINITTPYTVRQHKIDFAVEKTDFNPLSVKEQSLVDSEGKIFLPLGLQDTFIDWDFNGDVSDQIQASQLIVPTTQKENYQYYDWQTHTEVFLPESQVNLYRYGVENWAPTLTYKIDNGQFTPSLIGARFGDKLVNSLKENQLRVMMTVFGFYPPYDTGLEISDPKNQIAIKKYLDYVVARYGAYVDLWEIGNEANSESDFYKFVVPYLRKIDPYHHPISTNWEEPSSNLFDFVSLHHYELPGIDSATLNSSFATLSQTSHSQPIIVSELGLKQKSWFDQSVLELRQMLWLSTINQLGVVLWNQGQNGIYQNPDNANIYLGPAERTIIRNLRNFMPDLIYPLKKDQFLLKDTNLKAFSIMDQEYYLAYILNLGNQPERGYLTLPVPANYEVQLIEPKTNTVLSTFTTQFNNENFYLPMVAEDLAIKIKLTPIVL